MHAPRGNYHRQTRDTGTPDSGTSLGLPAPRGWDERRGRGGDQGATRRATPAADASWGMPWEMQGGATGSGPVGATGGPNRGQIRGGSARWAGVGGGAVVDEGVGAWREGVGGASVGEGRRAGRGGEGREREGIGSVGSER